MPNDGLMEKTGLCLLRKGYTVKTLAKSCFDMIARKGSTILLIKTLSDANAISEEHASQMKRLSSYVNASPLIIAETAGSRLESNVVYSRMGIYTLNFDTFRNSVCEKLPFIASTKAGLGSFVIGDKLRQKREDEGMSLAQLSRKIGVSRRMITRYEAGEDGGRSIVTMAKAERLYDALGHEVFDKIDIFSSPAYQMAEEHKTPVARKYVELGFDASDARKLPFSVISRKDEELILTGISERTNPEANLLSKLIDADSLLLFQKRKPKEKDTPSMAMEEFMEFEKANELIRFLREF